MKVGVVHNLRPGGAHRRLSEQLRHLDAEAIEVCLSTATPVGLGATVIPFEPRAPRYVPALRPPARYADLAALRRAWHRAALVIRGERVDVLYANPCRFLQAPAALLDELPPALYFCDEPRRVDHEPAGRSSRRRRTRALYAPLYRSERALDRKATSRAAALVTNSSHTAAAIRHAYGRTAEVLPMGVPEPMRAGGEGPGDAGESLLSVGPLLAGKGHDLAIDVAARTCRRRPLRIVAIRADEGESRRLHQRAAHAGVELRIDVALSDRELADAYRGAHATLCLSRQEPFGLVSLEAQACGCPVVVAAEGGLPETIREGATGWSAPRRAEALSELVDRLDVADVRERMSTAAAHHGAAHSWARSAQALRTALEALAA